jgi:uncharacterized membrane protein YhaH (DUF805 family)
MNASVMPIVILAFLLPELCFLQRLLKKQVTNGLWRAQVNWYLEVLRNYIGFHGRARRAEYWMFIIVNIIFTYVLGTIDRIIGWKLVGDSGVLASLYGVLIFLPWWAVQFRRLHDTDRSAWWLLLILIPFIGWLIIILFNCQRGTQGENRYGPDPLEEPAPHRNINAR